MPAGPAVVLRTLCRAGLDLLFPIACVGCGRYECGWLCADCQAAIGTGHLRCSVCGKSAPTGRTCSACLGKTPLMGVIAVGPYHDPVLQTAIWTLKFHGVRELARVLGELLAGRVVAAGLGTGLASPPLLVPLPLHRRRERARGFNQARLLAEAVATRLHLPWADLLLRTRATSPQTSILESPTARRRNIAGAFALRQPHAQFRMPTRVILIDDVLTTGATLTEAAEVLREAGAPEIWAAVIARG